MLANVQEQAAQLAARLGHAAGNETAMRRALGQATGKESRLVVTTETLLASSLDAAKASLGARATPFGQDRRPEIFCAGCKKRLDAP